MKDLLRRRFFSLTLRSHLLLLAFLLALPSIVLIIHSGFYQRNDSLKSGIAVAKNLAYNIATEQYNLTGDIEQLLVVLAQLPEVKTRDRGAANKILADVYRRSRQYGNIIIADRDGEIWGSALPQKERFSVKGRRGFEAARATRRFSSGEYTVGRISAMPTIGFSYPIFSQDGAFDGAISANIDFRVLNDLVVQAGLPAGSAYSIVDCKGVVVARNLNPETTVGRKDKADLFARMQKGPAEDTFIESDLGGERRIISYRKLKLPGEAAPYLYVRASIPLSEVLKRARYAEFVNIGILTLFLLGTLLLTVVVANYCFVARIRKLRRASQRIARGDFQGLVAQEVYGGELGDLGASLDEMARQLKAREGELNTLNAGLTRQIAEETERRLVQERLLARHARLAAIGEMIGAIAHQWRQPLAILGASAQSIKMAWKTKCLDTPFLENAVADVQTQLVYMSKTIEDFRRFFSPDKVIERFDVREKIQDVMLLVSPQFTHFEVTLAFDDRTQGVPVEIRGYPNEFKQSLLNLVSNSLDAIVELDGAGRQPGKGTRLVAIVLSACLDRVVIEVTDDGCGIPPEYADKVFEPYFTSKPPDKGTGIGLYMSKLIVEESMGGKLGFTSGIDGTRFAMEFPTDLAAQGELDG